jgi:hypothetical protein
MKDKIKILLEEKTNSRTLKDVIFNMWDRGHDFGDDVILDVADININPQNKKVLHKYIIEYLSKKIETNDEEKVLEYWKSLIVNTFPKTFIIDDGFYYVKFQINNFDFYIISNTGHYVIDCSVYISDKSYYIDNQDGKKRYFKDLEDSFADEQVIALVESEIRWKLEEYTNPFGISISDVLIDDVKNDSNMLNEQDVEKGDYLLSLIEDMNNGDIEGIETSFGELEYFFTLLIRKKRLNEIDFFSRDLMNSDSYNKVLYTLSQIDTPESFKIIEKAAGFYDIVEENGVYYWWGDREDWAAIFRDTRDGMSQKLIGKMLSEEFDSWEYWDPYHREPYEVYEELTRDNKHKVKVKMKEILLGKEMNVDEDETNPIILKLLKIQNSENTILLNNFALDMLLNDDDSVEMIFKNNSLDEYLEEDVFTELQRLFSYAEEEVYWNDCHKEVYNKITGSGYAENFEDGKWEKRPNHKGYSYKFEIKENLKSVLYAWLSEYKDYTDDIAYQGSYIGFIQQLGDFGYETAWAPDHASWYDAVKLLNSNYINDSF